MVIVYANFNRVASPSTVLASSGWSRATRENWSTRAARSAHPFETLVETVTRGGTCGLDVPSPLPQRVQAELVGDLGGVHGVWQILPVSAVRCHHLGMTHLFVGKDKQEGIPEFILAQHSLDCLSATFRPAQNRTHALHGPR